MAVARRYARAAAVADQAGQGQAAADFQDGLARQHRPARHHGGEFTGRGPHQAEQLSGGG
jgi:hypothetical protein